MEITPEDIDAAVRTLYGECRGEPMAGKVAVAWVILNRARIRKQSLTRVCKAPWQFSCWNENDPNRRKLEALKETDAGYIECLRALDTAMDGKGGDPTYGSQHYHTVGLRPLPTWALGHDVVCVIGNHCFYVGIDGPHRESVHKMQTGE